MKEREKENKKVKRVLGAVFLPPCGTIYSIRREKEEGSGAQVEKEERKRKKEVKTLMRAVLQSRSGKF